MKFVFVLDITEGVEQEVTDVSEDGGVAGRNAVLGEGGEELAEDEVDVGGGQEVAGERSRKLGTESLGYEELLFLAGVEETEGGMVLLTQHATLAAVGERELTEMGVRGSRAFSGHESLGEEDVTKKRCKEVREKSRSASPRRGGDGGCET